MANQRSELFTVDEIALELRLPAGTLRSWRAQDRGPKSAKLGRRVVYRRDDVDAWVAEQVRETGRGGTGKEDSRS